MTGNLLIQKKPQAAVASPVLDKPFFQKKEESSFFNNENETAEAETPFFNISNIQTKLSIGQPGDKFEQEADTVADTVVNNIQTKKAQNNVVQPKCEACENEQELQKKEDEELPDSSQLPVQEVAAGGQEENNDLTANLPEGGLPDLGQLPGQESELPAEVPLETAEEEVPVIQMVGGNCRDCTTEEDANCFTVQPKGRENSPQNANNQPLENKLHATKGSGNQMAEPVRTEMEQGFGADFSNVKINTGSDAIAMNQSLGAQAFTHGSDIYFNRGKYQPETTSGKHLLAHELTHVLQQKSATKIQRALCEENTAAPPPPRIPATPQPGSPGLSIPGLGPIINFVKQQVLMLIRQVVSWARSIISSIVNLAKSLLTNFMNLLRSVKSLIVRIMTFLKTHFRALYDQICQHFCDFLMPMLRKLVQLGTWAMEMYNNIKQFILGLWDTINSFILNLNLIGDAIFAGIEARVWSLVNPYLDQIRSFPGGSLIADQLSAVIGQMLSWIRTIISSIVSWIQSLWAMIKRCFMFLLRKIWNKILALLQRLKSSLPPAAQRLLQVADDLRRVRWGDMLSSRGLKGDWGRLFFVWFCETTPADLGNWINGSTVMITPGNGYIEDLKTRDHHRQTIQDFINAYVNNGTNCYVCHFRFTGGGTTTGNYSILEWFLGSYKTTICVRRFDPANNQLHVHFKVYNNSHWESGTRVPPSWIRMGFPPYLIPDMARSACGPGGDFFQYFIWNDVLQLPLDRGGSTAGKGCVFDPDATSQPSGNPVFFSQDESGLTADDMTVINNAASVWRQSSARASIRLDGYASEEGSGTHNNQLSCNRAIAVMDQLVVLGVPVEKIEIFAHGETQVFSATDRNPNRRVVINNQTS